MASGRRRQYIVPRQMVRRFANEQGKLHTLQLRLAEIMLWGL
ncbi:MAG: hypothetical protein ABSF37_00210 [Sedimentisphaerales bacterium]